MPPTCSGGSSPTRSSCYAQSGAGKTSLINAKLIPMLEAERGEVLPVARVQGPFDGLDPESIPNLFTFHALLSLAGPDADPRRLARTTLTAFLAQRAGDAPDDEDQPLVVIFDQFEEMFTFYPGHRQSEALLRAGPRRPEGGAPPADRLRHARGPRRGDGRVRRADAR